VTEDLTLRIDLGDDELLNAEAAQALKAAGVEIESPEQPGGPLRTRGAVAASDLIVALGSGGAFTALYQVLSALIARHHEREIQIERGGVKVSLKGHSLAEEKDLLARLFPEFASEKDEDETGQGGQL
jgi:hypothetical protein